MELEVAYMAKFGVPFTHKRGRHYSRLWFYGSLVPVLYVPAILGPWVKGLFGTHNSYTPCCGIKNRVYGKVCGALVLTIKGVPVPDFNFMAVWTPNCMYQPYWVRGSKGYLVLIAHIPSILRNQNHVYGLVWDSVIPTNSASLWQIMISWQFGPCTVRTSHMGSADPRSIWYINLIFPLLWNYK